MLMKSLCNLSVLTFTSHCSACTLEIKAMPMSEAVASVELINFMAVNSKKFEASKRKSGRLLYNEVFSVSLDISRYCSFRY